jgi:alpha/beta hydrolase fold
MLEASSGRLRLLFVAQATANGPLPLLSFAGRKEKAGRPSAGVTMPRFAARGTRACSLASVRLLLVPSEAAATGRATAYVRTSDGRTLVYQVQGDPGGVAVFSLHRTPGSRFTGLHPDPAKVRNAGLRLITYDRPGYGGSTRQHGRSVVDCVSDIVTIADELGLGRFAVTGGSGGAPHALAAAARLPERVTRVVQRRPGPV